MRHNEGIATLHLSDGTVASTLGRNQLLATPQGDNAPAQFTTVWTPTQQGVIVGTTDGLAMLLGNPGTSGLAVIDTLYRGHGAITAGAGALAAGTLHGTCPGRESLRE